MHIFFVRKETAALFEFQGQSNSNNAFIVRAHQAITVCKSNSDWLSQIVLHGLRGGSNEYSVGALER